MNFTTIDRLGRVQQAPVREAIWKALTENPHGLSSTEIAGLVYGHLRNGGPDWAQKCIQVAIHRMNEQLKERGINIRTNGNLGRRYRIIIGKPPPPQPFTAVTTIAEVHTVIEGTVENYGNIYKFRFDGQELTLYRRQADIWRAIRPGHKIVLRTEIMEDLRTHHADYLRFAGRNGAAAENDGQAHQPGNGVRRAGPE